MPNGNGNGRAEAIAELEAAKGGYAKWQADIETWRMTRYGATYRNITGLYPEAPQFAEVDPSHLTVAGLKAHAALAQEKVDVAKAAVRDRVIRRFRDGYIARETLDGFFEISGMEAYMPLSAVRIVADVQATVKPPDTSRTAMQRELSAELSAMVTEWLASKDIKATDGGSSYRITVGTPQ